MFTLLTHLLFGLYNDPIKYGSCRLNIFFEFLKKVYYKDKQFFCPRFFTFSAPSRHLHRAHRFSLDRPFIGAVFGLELYIPFMLNFGYY